MSTTTVSTSADDSATGTDTALSGGLLAVLLIASTLGLMSGAIIMPALDLIRSDFGVSRTTVGFVVTANSALIAATSPLVGKALDRWGVRVPLGAGLVLYGLAGGAGLVIDSFPVLIASRMLLGVGAAAVYNGTTVALLAAASGSRQDRMMGWRTASATASGLIWPLLAGVLGAISWHATFTVYLVGVPLGIAVLLLMPGERPAVTDDAQMSVFTLLRRYPTLVAWNALMVITGMMMLSLVVFIPQRLAQIGIHQPVVTSLFMALQSLASSIVGLGYARIRGRAGVGAVLRAATACWVCAFLLLGLSSNVVLIFCGAACFGVGYGMSLPTLTVLIGETPPVGLRGRATSLSGTSAFVGQFLAPLVFGPVMESISIPAGYLLAAAICAVISAILFGNRIRDPRREPTVL